MKLSFSQILSNRSLQRHLVLGSVALALVIILTVGLSKDNEKVSASTLSLHGWAWSDMPDGSNEVSVSNPPPCNVDITAGAVNQTTPCNFQIGRGAGWISMESANTGGSSYGVTVDSQTGTMAGYAWADNVGWVSFTPSDLGGCPSGSCSAHIDFQTGNVTGWIRALAANDPEAGGWDGWISLSGSNYGVHVNLATGIFSGYAWGDINMGWVDFSRVTMDVIASPLILSANPTNIILCQGSVNSYLTYRSPGNLTTPFSSCQFVSPSPSGFNWSSQNPLPQDTPHDQIASISSSGVYMYKLQCMDAVTNLPVDSNTVTVTAVNQKVLVTLNASCVPLGGTAGTLSWSGVGLSSTCTINNGIGAVPSAGTHTGVPGTTYTITCTNACNGSPVHSTATIPLPSQSCTATPTIPIFREV